MIRPIATVGDPVLRQRAIEADLTRLRRGAYAELVQDLVDTMRKAHGVGLAAPQIGQSVRVCALEVCNNPRYPTFAAFPLVVVVNPKLSIIDERRAVVEEACLSVPGSRRPIARPSAVRVTGVTPQGHSLDVVWSGVPAVIIQHEVDHLDGILITDKPTDSVADE